MSGRNFIGVREVADMLDYPSNEYFLRRRKRLERDFAFPKRCPWEKRSFLYRRCDVESWIKNASAAAQLPEAQGGEAASLQENVIMLAEAKVA